MHIGNLNPYVIAPVHFALAKRSADQVVLSLRSIACNTVAISTSKKASFVQREVARLCRDGGIALTSFRAFLVRRGNLNPYVIAPVHFALAKRSVEQVVLSLRSIACNTVAISTSKKASFVQREVSKQLPEELPYRVIASHRRYNPETKLISSKNRNSFEFRFLIYRFLSTRI